MEVWFRNLEGWMAAIPEPFGTLVNYTLVFVFLSFLFVLPLVTFTVLIERKVIGFMQHRYGPNRVGPRGWLQTIADAVKLIQKEDITPKLADPIPFWLAPILSFAPALIGFVVVGMGGLWAENVTQVGNETMRDFKVWAPVDLNVAVVFFLAMSAVSGVGTFIAGWASNNKYSLFGSMRGTAQVISYEVPMILTLLAVVLATGSMSFKDIALKQGPKWAAVSRDHVVEAVYWNPPLSQGQLAQLLNQELANQTGTTITGANAPSVKGSTKGRGTTFRVAANADIAGPDGTILQQALLAVLDPYGMSAPIAVSWRGKDHALEVATTNPPGGVTEADLQTKLQTALAMVYADAVAKGDLAADQVPSLSPENAPVVRVVTRPNISQILIGANVDIAGEDGAWLQRAVQGYTNAEVDEARAAALADFEGEDPSAMDAAAMTAVAGLIAEKRPGGLLPKGEAGMPRLMAQAPLRWTLVSGGIPFLVPMFLGFVIFFITATAETNRAPFDLPEAESELVSGFHTEYTGMKFALFFLGEYAAMILISSVATICFLGAWWVPAFMAPLAIKWPVLYFFSYFLKMYSLIYIMIWFRSTFPRLRPDQLMDFAWKGLLPLSLIHLVIVGYMVFVDWNWKRLLEVNYQLWYQNVIAGLDWPVIRLMMCALLLPLIPDLFRDAYPRVRKYLYPVMWVFPIAFVCDDGIGHFLSQFPGWGQPFRILLMDAIYMLCLYWFGMSFVTLAERYPVQQKVFKISLFALMAIIPVTTVAGTIFGGNPELAEAPAWVARVLWWIALVPALPAIISILTYSAPEERVAIQGNPAIPFKRVSYNVGNLKAELSRSSDLTPFYNRERPAVLDVRLTPADIPDWRTARFPDEEKKGPAAMPGQQEWGQVRPLPGMNTR